MGVFGIIVVGWVWVDGFGGWGWGWQVMWMERLNFSLG